MSMSRRPSSRIDYDDAADKIDPDEVTSTKCTRCHQEYDVNDNWEEACAYHPGPTRTTTHVRQLDDEITYVCCGVTNRGNRPENKYAHGCMYGPHISMADKLAAARQAAKTKLTAVSAFSDPTKVQQPGSRGSPRAARREATREANRSRGKPY
eukprot:GFYU01000923.1.p1 GENE.GFYU01000923.1~~GFYU01000923.1.p1  ORF type:complete len:153 (+),score=23.46 GFYU01000923.1:139-597(+)